MAMLEARPYRPFKSSEVYLEAMKEDLAEWLNTLYPDLCINAENFMDRLDTGVALCKHANYVRQAAVDYLVRRQARNKSMTRSMTSGLAGPILALGNVHYLPAAKSGTFFARDNVSNFITWCKKSLKIIECLLFETDDLIMRKNEKHVILCLLDVARRGAKFGMLAPMLVQMERQIDREIAADIKANGSSESSTQTEVTTSAGTGTGAGAGAAAATDTTATTTNITTITTSESLAIETDLYDSDSENEDDSNDSPMLMYGPQPQIITNDLKSLDEMVRDLVEKCTCPSQFPMVRVSEGKYRIGDTKVLIFVRILRSHVMVRVGGGWDTLSHYLDKHDPCRCRAQHRSSVAARLIPRNSTNSSNGIELHKAQVIFERSPPAARRVFNSSGSGGSSGNNNANGSSLLPSPSPSASPSASSSPGMVTVNGQINNLSPNHPSAAPISTVKYRSRSPTPQRKFHNQTTNSGSAAGGEIMGNVNGHGNGNQQQQQQQLLGSSPSLARRSMSPSPRRLIDMRKKQSSFESSYSSNGPKSLPMSVMGLTHDNDPDTIGMGGGGVAPSQQVVSSNGEQNNSSKFENISDNGSEISDEGYRSLGVIQANAQKRESLHSQASIEDAESNVRLDQTSSDSQISPTEEPIETETEEKIETADILEVEEEQEEQEEVEQIATVAIGTDIDNDYSICDGPQSLPAILAMPKSRQDQENQGGDEEDERGMQNKFEQSGVYITDDAITVDVAKNNQTPPSTIGSKIPRSPLAQRRRSIDNSTCGGGAGGSLQDLSTRSGLPTTFSRKQPVYRSVRRPQMTAATPTPTPTPPPRTKGTQLPMVRDVTNTWSGGRTSVSKKRPIINADTFASPSSTSSGSFDRSSKGRSSQILYDSNGRRVRGCSSSLTTSPVKNHASSPLAQQLLEAASSAKNDAQILEKMKTLLSRYAAGNQAQKQPGVGSVNGKKTPIYDDFTTAWVHSNGNLERSESCSPPAKARSKRSSAASSCGSNHSTTIAMGGIPGTSSSSSSAAAAAAAATATAAAVVSPRRERGMSKIPAPVRHHTELY